MIESWLACGLLISHINAHAKFRASKHICECHTQFRRHVIINEKSSYKRKRVTRALRDHHTRDHRRTSRAWLRKSISSVLSLPQFSRAFSALFNSVFIRRTARKRRIWVPRHYMASNSDFYAFLWVYMGSVITQGYHLTLVAIRLAPY